MTGLIIVGGIVVLALLIVVVMYNALVRVRNAVHNAYAQIDVQLKRRHDLIPNLIETVKGYVAHERSTLESVTAARAAAMSAEGPASRAQAENALTAALTGLFAVAESYPDLKASQNFLHLQEELATSENRIAYSRQYYNDAVLTYNTKVQTIPWNVIALIAVMRVKEYFRAPDEERGPVQVQF